MPMPLFAEEQDNAKETNNTNTINRENRIRSAQPPAEAGAPRQMNTMNFLQR